jgi:hypothetical protein
LPSTYTIFLSGPIDSPVAYRWREELRSANNLGDLEFAYLDLEEGYHPAEIASETVSMLKDCEGVLARYEPGSDQAQTACELLMAKRFELPVVVWTDQYTGTLSSLNPWWRYVATTFEQTGRGSIETVHELAE